MGVLGLGTDSAAVSVCSCLLDEGSRRDGVSSEGEGEVMTAIIVNEWEVIL